MIAARIIGPPVRAIDRHLRQRQKIFEFTDDPDCLYRIRFCPAYRDLPLADGVVRKGEPVAEFHWWNEHLPPVGEEGLGLDWGVRVLKMAMRTHRLMAREYLSNPDWAAVRAIGGTTAMFAAVPGSRWERRMGKFGYTVLAHENPSGAFSEFWQQVWAWALWHTYQAGTRRVLAPSEMSRTDVWISVGELTRRYGESKGAADDE